MDRRHLPNKFFAEHPLEEISAAKLTHFKIVTGKEGILDQIFADVLTEHISEKRQRQSEEERNRIEQTDDPAALVELVRKGSEISNQALIVSKILRVQEEAMPLLLRRYRTSSLDHFIEVATEVFAQADKEYITELRKLYPEIRAPYAQACACLAFGMQGMGEEIPFLLNEYERFRKEYPKESFEQHPLLALYILHDKI